MTTRRVFTFNDGSQVLIETWTSGDLEHQTAAFRRHRGDTWGAPVHLDYADDDKR